MISDVRIAHRGETPSSWKATVEIRNANLPSGLGPSNAVVVPVLNVNTNELRARTLRLSLPINATNVQNGKQRGGYILGGSGTTWADEISNLTSVANTYAFAGLKLTCAGDVSATLDCDLKSGNYRIPACTSIQVGVMLWRNDAVDPSIQAFAVSAEIVDCEAGPYTRPVRTCIASIAAGANMNPLGSPWTRWVDVYAPNAVLGDANAPIVTLESAWQGPLRRDYVNETWFPSGEPMEINRISSGASQLSVANDGAALAPIGCTQYLEW